MEETLVELKYLDSSELNPESSAQGVVQHLHPGNKHCSALLAAKFLRSKRPPAHTTMSSANAVVGQMYVMSMYARLYMFGFRVGGLGVDGLDLVCSC